MIFSQQIDEGYAECSTLSAEASGGSRGGIKWVIPPTSIQQFFAHEKNRQSLACVIYLPAVAPPEGEASPPLWVDVQKLYNMCAFIVMELLRITRQIPNPTNSLCTAVNMSASGGHRTLHPL